MDSILAGSGIVAASISANVADALLAGTGKDLKTLQSDLDAENPHVTPDRFTVPKKKLELTTKVARIKKTDRNVIALLPPGKSAGPAAEYVMLGAHYDHLGHGESGGGMGVKGAEGQ